MDNRSTRLTAVIAAVVAVLAVGALIATTYLNIGAHEAATSTGATSNPVDGTPAPGDPLEPSGSASPSPSDPTGDGHDVEERYTPDAATAAEIRSVSRRFVDAWKTPGSPTERTQALTPLATEYLTRLLARVDPLDLPTSAKVVGQPKIAAATPYAAGTEVKLSNGWTLRVNLLLDTTGWRVSEILPPDQAAPDAEPTPTDNGALNDQDASPAPSETAEPGGAGLGARSATPPAAGKRPATTARTLPTSRTATAPTATSATWATVTSATTAAGAAGTLTTAIPSSTTPPTTGTTPATATSSAARNLPTSRTATPAIWATATPAPRATATPANWATATSATAPVTATSATATSPTATSAGAAGTLTTAIPSGVAAFAEVT
jgi:hypothetical protein